MVVTESVLIEIGLKVLGADGMIDSRDATLGQRPEALDSVGVGILIDIDLSTMLNSLVPVSSIGNPIVAVELIGIDDGSPSHVTLDEGHDGGAFDIGDNRCGDMPLPLDYADDGGFALGSPSSLAPSDSAEVGLIDFNLTVKRDSIFAEQCPDLPEHSPSSLVSDSSYPLKLFGRMPRAGSGHPEHGIEPGRERSSRLVEDGVGSRINLVSAIIALVARSALNPVVLCHLVANWAMQSVWPSVILQPLKNRIIVREVTLELTETVLLELYRHSFGHFSIPPIHVLYHKMYVVSRDSYQILFVNILIKKLKMPVFRT